MKNLRNFLRKDDGYEALGTYVFIAGAAAIVLAGLVWATVAHAHQPRTSYTAICGDMKTYARVSIDRCEDSKLGAEWLYVEDGDRLPKIGEDASNASTRPQGVYDVRHAKR